MTSGIVLNVKRALDNNHHLVAQVSLPCVPSWDLVVTGITRLLYITCQTVLRSGDTWGALLDLKIKNHTFLPGLVVYKETQGVYRYEYAVVCGAVPDNLTYARIYHDDSHPDFKVVFSSST